MKIISVPFRDMRLNTTIPGTKTRVTISSYDNAWVFIADTDITDRVIKPLPTISIDLEKGMNGFTKDQIILEVDDEDNVIRDMFELEDRNFLLLIEKGFDGVADWLAIFDGIIDRYESECIGRNITQITAYSMEGELELHPAWQAYNPAAGHFPNINALGAAFTIAAISNNLGRGQPGVKKMEYEYDAAAGNPYKLIFDGGAPVWWGLNVLQWIYDSQGAGAQGVGLQIQSSNNPALFSTEAQSDGFVMGDLVNVANIGNWWQNRSLTNLVGDLWNLSNINIPGGNRTINVPAVNIPVADFSKMSAREALNELAIAYNCIHKRTERDTALFVSRSAAGSQFHLNNNLYKTNFNRSWQKPTDGVHVINKYRSPGTKFVIVDSHNVQVQWMRGDYTKIEELEQFKTYIDQVWEAYSINYQDGDNIKVNNRFIDDDNRCYCANEINGWYRFTHRIFKVTGFFLIELEPYDRVYLTIRNADGTFDEEIKTVLMSLSYDDTEKTTELILVERKMVLYERYNCIDQGAGTVFGVNWKAQTYTIGNVGLNDNHDLVQVRLKLYRTGLPGNATLAIRLAVAGNPTGGPNLATSTISGNAFTLLTGGGWYEFNFAGLNQLPGTQYALVLSAPGGSAGNSVHWRRTDITVNPPNYTGGSEWDSAGSGAGGTWGQIVAMDLNFETWGEFV